ncbi:MAG TPA: SRPBCC family protein, partial [Solirubrobacterales bacterium]|nr:SRPBCC family protein [Solirubrobacterales bacterium]
MARVVRRRRIAAPASALWSVVSDPHHLPRWWPRTRRVENVRGETPDERSWTQVLETRDGRGIRADYRSVTATPSAEYVYEQTLEGTPFERFLRAARTEIRIEPENGAS